MPAHRYLEENGSAAMLAAKRLAGVAPQMNLWERVTRMLLQIVNKAAHSGFETQRRYPHKKDLWPPKTVLHF